VLNVPICHCLELKLQCVFIIYLIDYFFIPDKDSVAVQTVIEKVRDGVAGFSENELYETNLFLLLNSNLVQYDSELEESELGHLVGIAPIISVDLLLSLSVEVISPQIFLYDAMSFLPAAASYQLITSFVSHYLNTDFWKVAGNLDMLCLAIYRNCCTSKCDEDFQSFFNLLKTVLTCMQNQEPKSNFCEYFSLSKAVLLLLKFCLRGEVPPRSQKSQHVYARPTVSHTKNTDNQGIVKRIVIHFATKICCSAPTRLKSETNEEDLVLFESARELAFECVTELQKLSPSCDDLLDILLSFAKSPEDVLNNIKTSNLSSLCSNSVLENANQHLWLKALIHHQEALEDEGTLMTLHKLVHLFEEDDNIFVCCASHNFLQSKSDLFRDLALKCFRRLSLEAKLKVLESRLMNGGSQGNVVDENCELNILEVLNRLVAREGTDGQVSTKCFSLSKNHCFL